MAHIDLSKMRFLVCDDNAHMRKIVRTLLVALGAREIKEAEDGAACLEAIQAYKPDILILDWVMPIFDGLEVIRMIRSSSTAGISPFLPIIMLTGYSEKSRVMLARDAGVTEFLCKPISAKSLYQRVLSIVLQPRPFVRTKTYFGPDRRRFKSENFSGEDRRQSDPDIIDLTNGNSPQTKVQI